MVKITFLGAGSVVFAKNVLGDCMLTDSLKGAEVALYDINPQRLEEGYNMIQALKKNLGSDFTFKKYCGVENRKEALRGANFVVNAIQVGGYEPSTVIDFEIPKKYGLKQTIADTLGIGGIFRALRTIPVLREIAEDVEAVCPNAWFLNYTNPMAMLTGFMQRYTNVKTIGLCHSVQVCSKSLFKTLGMEVEGYSDKIAGINHMAWLLEIRDAKGNDLYPEIRKRALEANNEKHGNMVRIDYINKLGYYCTESSEHNAEYNPFYIKNKYPELIEKFNIPIDEYITRCINAIETWGKQRDDLMAGGNITHERSDEYASRIMNAMITNEPYTIGGNVINTGLITNLPSKACVEVPCVINSNGINPTYIGELPLQLAAMNITNINPQLLTIEAAVTKKRETVYHAAMMDPHTASELSIDDIRSLCDDMIEAHNNTEFKVLI